MSSRAVTLEDGSYVEIIPGVEEGFYHCCGDANYKMEIDCSINQLRCYEGKRGRWKYTYGRVCKTALGAILLLVRLRQYLRGRELVLV